MRLLAFVWILAAVPLVVQAQSFRQDRFGIVPLHSTRADVERLYGTCNDSSRCIFRTKTETIAVEFASSPCKGFIYGWDVPKDTVLSFTARPYDAPLVSDIALDLNGFAKRYSPEDPTTYYTNVEKGILFALQEGRLISVTYYPPSSEKMKRCAGFPAWDGVPAPTPFARIIGPFGKDDVEAVLDNLGFELSTNTRARGYIVAYAGKKSRRGEGKKMADSARQYLINRRMIPSDRIIPIDGGFRETAQYDLFSLSPEVPPPTPTPTVPSNEVQIIRRTTRPKRP